MSYFQAGADMNKNIHQGFSPQTPLLHDVMAIQAVYGADMTTRTGDTTYGFNATFGNSVWDFAFNTTPIVCIWDAAGNDTLNLGGYNFAQTIDLREGAFSSIMGLELNLSIAHGCKVENAVGGTSADTVIGNALGNVLYGGAGGDALYGLGGNDVLVGGVGADAFVFVNGGQGSNGWDLITDFGVGVDRVLLDDTFFGTSAATLTAQIKTQAQGWAYLEFSASDGVVFQGVTEAALEQALSGFAFV
jgi:serralysin